MQTSYGSDEMQPQAQSATRQLYPEALASCPSAKPFQVLSGDRQKELLVPQATESYPPQVHALLEFAKPLYR